MPLSNSPHNATWSLGHVFLVFGLAFLSTILCALLVELVLSGLSRRRRRKGLAARKKIVLRPPLAPPPTNMTFTVVRPVPAKRQRKPANPNLTRTRCQNCGNLITLNKDGRMRAHGYYGSCSGSGMKYFDFIIHEEPY